jgi:glycosyltransferase involved in cell wall biosynthesis
VDLSYLHEAQKLEDICYLMEVNPRFLRGPAFNIQKIHPKAGIFKAVDVYPEFSRLQGFIDLDKFYVVNTPGRLWVLKSFWTHLQLLIFLLRGRFGVLHLAWPPNLYEFPLYLLRGRMLLTVHDPFPHSGLDTFIVRLRRQVAFRLIPRFVILNKAQRRQFLACYHLSDTQVKDSRLSCYTYLRTVAPQEAGIPPRGSFILFAGKISPYKGLDYLLPAMEQVHRLCPDCRLIVAGSGKFHFDVSRYQQFDYIDIRNRFIPDTELVSLIDHCAFMVCPYTDATQSGVVMSAFAFSKPVIATDVGGLPEMVRHRHYGLIVKEKDAGLLAESIVCLWTHPDTAGTYAAEIARDYGAGHQSWKKVAEELTSEYRQSAQ